MELKNTHSLRVHYRTWSDSERCREQLDLLREFRGTIDEVAFFTGDTHPPLPLVEVRRRAALLQSIIPEYKALGLRVGINHLATIGHLDENPENSLNEPWQHLVDKSGTVSKSCYCAADPAVQTYIRECYAALAAAGPEFIWIDDDVRLESHPPVISLACFCPFCLADFGVETGATRTREELLAAFKGLPSPQRMELRRRWLEHSRQYVARILRLARASTDSVAPDICLGLMTGEAISGWGYEAWTDAMAGAQRLEVKFRPGGGFYTDENPTALLGKCHSVGRQNAFVPVTVTDIQYEHENFPYIRLNKSRAAFLAEMTGAIAAGCTGVALNTLGISGDPLEEYRPYFDAVKNARPFFDELVATCGRSSCEGVWTAFGLDHRAALGPDGEWPGPGAWGGDFHAVNELFTLGLPAAYTRSGAALTILIGDNVLEWSTEQLREFFAGGVMLDGPALHRLAERGLAGWAGFEVVCTRAVDTIERFTADPLNGRFAGWHRDCRPSFWPRPTYLLRPTATAARPLAECESFTPTNYGCCAGVFENEMGGRVAVFGYYPWNMLGNLAKTTQLRNVTRWLSRDRLPAYIESYHRIALWSRRDAAGRPAYVLINASMDSAEGVVLKARDLTVSYHALNMQGDRSTLIAADTDGPYRSLPLPPLPPWSALLVQGPCHSDSLDQHFRGEIRNLEIYRADPVPAADDLDLRAMAAAALNYLRGNPDPARNYECKFSLGPLGIPVQVPLLPPNAYGFDPIALGDTDSRMDWQYPHMQAMAGDVATDSVRDGVRRRIRSYQRPDGLLWMNPGAFAGTLQTPSVREGLKHEWASSWSTGKYLYSLAEEFARTGDVRVAQEARHVFTALQALPCRDGARAWMPYGTAPWRAGEWMHMRDSGKNYGWGGEHSHNYPFFVEPLVRYWECCGDKEALALAVAMADGHLEGLQPDMEELRIDPATGSFARHVHLHTHEVWGVAHLGAVTGEARFLDWAENAYRFVLSQGTDYGWYPEYIPQHKYRAEICVVGDMTSIAACLARGGRPEFWDHVERTVRNELRRSQFSLTPAFLALFREIHQDQPPAVIEAALVELRKLEGGFVAQPAHDDWVGCPDNPKLGTPGLYANGIQMMGCCPPEGMRGLWEAWEGIVQERTEGVFVNLSFSREHAAANVRAYEPAAGRLDVQARKGGSYFLRPPAWAEPATVTLRLGGADCRIEWGGPANAYVVCRAVQPGERLTLGWAVPRFTQVFVPQSVPGRSETLTVHWLGNQVLGVEPRGQYLPMFVEKALG